MATLTQQSQKPVKKVLKKERHFPWMFCVAVIVTVFIASRAFGLLQKKANAREMNIAYQNELKELDQKEIDMRTELEELQTPEGVEREIREKFRVTKQGEELVVVVPPAESKDIDDDQKGIFHFLRNIFKKNK